MLDMSAVIGRMLVILLLLAVGFLSRKLGYTDEVSNQRLSRIIINVAQCGLILASVMNVESPFSRSDVFLFLGLSFLLTGFLVGLGYLTPLLLRVKGPARGTYIFMTAFGNVGFLGMPVIGSIFGTDAVFLPALFCIPFNLFVYSIGISMVSGGAQKARFSYRAFLNPPVIFSFAALIIFLLDIPFPEFVATSADTLGEMVLPGTLLVLGGSLGGMTFRETFTAGGWRCWAQLFIKLLVIPVIVWALLRLVVHNATMLGVFTVIAAMPIAAASTMLSLEHGGDEKLASRGVFLSTLLSVFTIPLVVWLLLI